MTLAKKVEKARALQIRLDGMNAEMKAMKEDLWNEHSYNFTRTFVYLD
jgi:hypothetical protein